MGCNTGVSTSRKPFSSNILLIIVITLERNINVSLDFVFVIKSTYLRRYLSSISVSPWNFSGKGLSALDRWVNFVTRILNSSVLVFIIVPLIPTISPKSDLLKISKDSSPSTSNLKYSWICPAWSIMFANPAFPFPLFVIIRPAIVISGVSLSCKSSFEKSAYLSLRVWVVLFRSNLCPKGSTLWSLKKFSFSLLTISWSDSFCIDIHLVYFVHNRL